MTKPNVSLARWADLGGAFVTAPSSGLRDTGFLDGTPADADIVNYEINQLYQWALYLSTGALVGDHSIAGGLAVGGQLLSFANFTFTADATTNQILHTAHGLQTGDGPVRVSSSGTLPGGLTAGTDYWVIDNFGDALQFTTSLNEALSNTPAIVDITTTGTGTHTLLHQFSTARVTDATVSRELTVGGDLSVTGRATVGGDLTVGDRLIGFADFTFTADNTADTIIHTAHGLQTGDGPVRVANAGGGLPGGLAAATDYYFVRIDGSTGKLATSRANALIGTAINLTTDGTGTQTLLHQAGTSRPADAALARDLSVAGAVTVTGLLLPQLAIKGTGTRAAAPSTGFHTAGEFVYNADPIAGGKEGWVCVTSGTPGIWKAFGAIDP